MDRIFFLYWEDVIYSFLSLTFFNDNKTLQFLFLFSFESNVISPLLDAFNILCLLLLALSNLIVTYFGIDFFWVWWTSCFYGFIVFINLQKLTTIFSIFFMFPPSRILILHLLGFLKLSYKFSLIFYLIISLFLILDSFFNCLASVHVWWF